MVTITRQTLFINIFQIKHFSAAKFYMGYEKHMSFLVIPKSPKVGKRLKNRMGSFKCIDHLYHNLLLAMLNLLNNHDKSILCQMVGLIFFFFISG